MQIIYKPLIRAYIAYNKGKTGKLSMLAVKETRLETIKTALERLTLNK